MDRGVAAPGTDSAGAAPGTRHRLAPLAENVGEAFTACMLAMVQGNLLVVSVSHVVVATQTGLASGVLATAVVWMMRARSRWVVALTLGLITSVVDYMVHPGMFGPVFAEAAVTGAVAAALSYGFGWLLALVKGGRKPAVPLALLFLAVPWAAAAQAPADSLRLTYFGAAGWELTDGTVTVLVDPYLSRIKYGGGGHPDDDRPDFARTDLAWSDTVLIDSLVTEADFILVHHGHFDHLGDVPYIARKTGAKVIGTETTITILRAYGVPDDQLYAVRGGEDYQFDDFSVRVVPTLHSALDEKHYYDARRWNEDSGLEAPLRIDQFIEGGSLSFLARFAGHTVLTMGSMNFIEREYEGLDPDVLLAGINGSRLGLYRFDERLLRATGYPPVVLPTHWDDFRLPYGFSQEANRQRNLVPFVETAAAIAPGTRVITPRHLEPVVLRGGARADELPVRSRIDVLPGQALREPDLVQHPDGTLFAAGYSRDASEASDPPNLFRSRDGGGTWQQVDVGRVADGALGNSDVDLEVGPDGTLYFLTMGFDRSVGEGTHVALGVSPGGGEEWMWQEISRSRFDDRPWIGVPDGGRQHVVWNDGQGVRHALRAGVGAAWSEGPRIADAGGSSHLAVGPSGELAVRIAPGSASGRRFDEDADHVAVSLDDGASWTLHPAPGLPVWDQVARWVEPLAWGDDGALYALWTEGTRLRLGRSGDHGASWTAWTVVQDEGPVYHPFLTPGPDGLMAASWFSGEGDALRAHVGLMDTRTEAPRLRRTRPLVVDAWQEQAGRRVRETAGEYFSVVFLADGDLGAALPIQNAEQGDGFAWIRIGVPESGGGR